MSGRIYDIKLQDDAAEKIGYKLPPRIVKSRDIVPARRDTLLKNLDYMEAQIGRLAKMARDMRAELLLLTTE